MKMFYLVQFDDATLGIYPQKRVNIENGIRCTVKHKGGKYEASVIKKSASMERLKKKELEMINRSDICIIPAEIVQGHQIEPGCSARENNTKNTSELMELPSENAVQVLDVESLSPKTSDICSMSGGLNLENSISEQECSAGESGTGTDNEMMNHTPSKGSEHITDTHEEIPVDPPLAESTGICILSNDIVQERQFPDPVCSTSENEPESNYEIESVSISEEKEPTKILGDEILVEMNSIDPPSGEYSGIPIENVQGCRISAPGSSAVISSSYITTNASEVITRRIFHNLRQEPAIFPCDEIPIEVLEPADLPIAGRGGSYNLSNEIVHERQNPAYTFPTDEFQNITQPHMVTDDISGSEVISFECGNTPINILGKSDLPLAESSCIRNSSEEILEEEQCSETTRSKVIFSHNVSDSLSEDSELITHPHESSAWAPTESDNSLLDQLPSHLMNESYILSFDCQPGEMIDLNDSELIIGPQPSIITSSISKENVSPFHSEDIEGTFSKDESDCEKIIRDPDFIPENDGSDTTDSDSDEGKENDSENNIRGSRNNSRNISSFLNETGLQPCDENEMYVEKSRGRNGDRKSNFCVYCHKKQQKLARHLVLKHKNEEDVKKFIDLPKNTVERRTIIEVIRKRGNYIFNTNKDYNDGELIVSRRPNPKFTRNPGHYIACGNCKAFFAKTTLRSHYTKCSRMSSAKTRSVMVMSKRVMGRIHPKATEIVRKQLFPQLREDIIVRNIRYDELLIIFANKMVEKYKNVRHFEMIRQRLRLLGRFIITMRKLNGEISDMASVFDPKFIDITTNAINTEAKLKSDHLYQTPTVAFTLGTLLKQVGNILVNECIKQHDDQKKINTENFLKLFAQEVLIGINRTVSESQFQLQRRKPTVLPSLDDIKKLHNYLTTLRSDAFNQLNSEFSYEAWIKLSESTLSSVQLFNRRRAGEVERILIEDFLSFQSIDENTDKDLFRSLSKESQEVARKYVRFAIRGKLNRNVPVLLDHSLVQCMQLLLRYREEAGVPDTNPYIFGIRSVTKMNLKYLRSCALMRRFAESCGAKNPDRLRGTELRKHIATTCITLNLSEGEISDLANFMGHRESIHKNFYRQPIVNREILKMSKLLEVAQGANSKESDDESSDDEGTDPKLTLPSSNMESSGMIPKKRSTSPYGNVKRMRWNEEEKNTVLTAYADHIKNKTLPSLAEIQNLIVQNPCLRKRHSAQIKTWIHNQYKSSK